MVNTSNKGPSNKKRGRSKKAHVLAASVEQATENFLDKGDKIAKESQFLKEELVAAVEDVRKQGRSFCSWIFFTVNRTVSISLLLLLMILLLYLWITTPLLGLSACLADFLQLKTLTGQIWKSNVPRRDSEERRRLRL